MTETKTEFQVTINGRTFTRKSARPYTHVVIFFPKETAESEIALYRVDEVGHRKIWDQQHRIATLAPADHPALRRATEFIALYPDAETYISDGMKRHERHIRKLEAEGFFDWQVASWHQSESNAVKAERSHRDESAASMVVPVGSDLKLSPPSGM